MKNKRNSLKSNVFQWVSFVFIDFDQKFPKIVLREIFKINFLHDEKIFFDEIFLNLIYSSSAFQRTRLELQRTKNTTLARGSVSETPDFIGFWQC